MPVLNHYIVAAKDKESTAVFFAEMLDLAPAGEARAVRGRSVSGDTTLDFVDNGGVFDRWHFAFLAPRSSRPHLRPDPRPAPRLLRLIHAGRTQATEGACTSMIQTGTCSRSSPGATGAPVPTSATPIHC